ncbi:MULTISPECIES: aldose epimerase [Corynebacterium]|uniref:aldose epimerase n=1 Tax=Corynebacterium TaxID=1716 RepID=UPI001CEF782C|nr:MULTISPECIES: aldose epimerase [Corynebacterium]
MSLQTSLSMPAGHGHLESARHSSGELLFMSELADFSENSSIRGGVPVIAPWFSKDLGHDELQHGWARRIQWEVQDTTGGIDARCTHDGWDLRFSAQHTEQGFALMLRAHNLTEYRRLIQLAFHPYFLVDDVTGTEVAGAERRWLFDGTATDERVATEQYSPFTISDGARTLTITSQGTDHVVVWNPGAAADENIGDLQQGDWKRFVCVEPALLGPDSAGHSVGPEDWAAIGMTVKVS